MNLKEFLKEERDARKDRRQQEKILRKKHKSPEQKRYVIFSIIFTIIIICSFFLFYCTGNNDPYDWNSVIGITNEMKTNLTKEFDENTLYFSNKLDNSDLDKLNQNLQNVGIRTDESLDTTNFAGDLILTDREIGAFAVQMNDSLGATLNEICAIQIYMVGEVFYEKSLVKINLTSMSLGNDLPSIYLTTTSKIEVLSKTLSILQSSAIINNLTQSESDEILTVLNNNTSRNLKSYANEVINSYINLLCTSLDTDMELLDGAIKYTK